MSSSPPSSPYLTEKKEGEMEQRKEEVDLCMTTATGASSSLENLDCSGYLEVDGGASGSDGAAGKGGAGSDGEEKVNIKDSNSTLYWVDCKKKDISNLEKLCSHLIDEFCSNTWVANNDETHSNNKIKNNNNNNSNNNNNKNNSSNNRKYKNVFNSNNWIELDLSENDMKGDVEMVLKILSLSQDISKCLYTLLLNRNQLKCKNLGLKKQNISYQNGIFDNPPGVSGYDSNRVRSTNNNNNINININNINDDDNKDDNDDDDNDDNDHNILGSDIYNEKHFQNYIKRINGSHDNVTFGTKNENNLQGSQVCIVEQSELKSEESSKLDFSKNNLHFMELFIHLSKISLKSNEIKQWPIFLEKCKHLTDLDLSFNQLKDIDTVMEIQRKELKKRSEILLKKDIEKKKSIAPKTILQNVRNWLGFSSQPMASILADGSTVSNISPSTLSKRQGNVHSTQNDLEVDAEYDFSSLIDKSRDAKDIKFMPSLKHLDLTCNQISTFPQSLFHEFLNITHLSLSYNPIITISPGIKKMTNLTKLQLASCGLSSIPMELFQLTSLEYLDLSENTLKNDKSQISLQKINDQIISFEQKMNQNLLKMILEKNLPLEIGTLKMLKNVQVNKCELFDITSIFQLPLLETLNASGNQLTSLIQSASLYLICNEGKKIKGQGEGLPVLTSQYCETLLPGLKTLKRLYLNKNKIKRMEEYWSCMTQLRELEVNSNQLESVDTSIFIKCTLIQHLDLGKNMISELHANFVNISPNLTSLNLSGNQITGTFYLPLVIHQHLKYINLQDNRLCNISIVNSNKFLPPSQCEGNTTINSINADIPLTTNNTTFEEVLFPSLVELNLSNNCIEEISQNLLKNCPKLEKLDLKGNCIKSIDINVSLDWKHLKYLDMSFNELRKENQLLFEKTNISETDLKKLFMMEVSPLQYLNISQNCKDLSQEMKRMNPQVSGERNEDVGLLEIKTQRQWLFKFEEPSHIEKGIYIGSANSVSSIHYLKEKLNITHILNVAKDVTTMNKFITQTERSPCEMEHLHLKITEQKSTKLEDYYEPAFAFIDRAVSKNKACLVHCLVGVSRSASIVIAYLMKKDKISYEEAYDRVRSKRSIILPNENFRKQLQKYVPQ